MSVGDIAIAAVLLAACAFLTWEVWLGLAKGFVHLPFGGRVQRTARSATFWYNFGVYAAALVVTGGLFAYAAVQTLAHARPH
jgi:hypothetical protein